jgi:GTP-binding protein
MFIDRVAIDVEAGSGGDGCCSFRRERYVPRGGPDGGDGGNGGSIVLVAEEGVDSLTVAAHRKHWRSDRGQHGQGSDRTGKCAEDLILKVPVGTIVIDRDSKLVIKDLKQPGDRLVAARGGRGGKGNSHFKSATNRVPRESTPGEKGEHRQLILELKLIADVGLIGKPNAGKSTLLSRLTRARPEIADYPFTTKHPNLGMVQVGFDQTFILADIPGLIEGAHIGVGLGFDFLRHVQRTKVLVHLIEPQPMDETDPVANYHNIREELVQFDPELKDRPEIVAITKSELGDCEELRAALAIESGQEPLVISAVTGQGLNQLVQSIVHCLNNLVVS